MSTLILDTIKIPTPQDTVQAAEASEQLKEGKLDLKSVPEIALQLLHCILTQMALGNTVGIQKIETELSTVEAAEYLNVSRTFILKLLNEGKLPYHMVGTHRRIKFTDLVLYKNKQDERSYQLMEELQAEAQKMNMGY